MKIFLILFFILLTNCHGYSQHAIGKISKSVGFLSFEEKGSISGGTGTLMVKLNATKDSFKVFIVTNYHVLPTAEQNHYVHFKIREDSLKDSPFLDLAIQIYDDQGKAMPNTYFDQPGDLAFIDLTAYFASRPQFKHILSNSLSTEFLATKTDIDSSEIDLGTEILFIGYPSMLFDKRNISPITRTGIVGTFPDQDFYFSDEYRTAFYTKYHILIPEKLEGFLIDATAAGGSSGSLVLSKPKFFRMNKSGQQEIYNDPNGQIFVLGILSLSYWDPDLRMTGVQHVNLGGVISSRQITADLKLFYK